MKTILYVFAGRRPNLELQLPYVRHILDQHPQVEYHVWNLARDPHDYEWVRTIAGERITVHNAFYQGDGRAQGGQVKVWGHYEQDGYRGTLFVKLDDDVVFLEADQFGQYLEAIEANPDTIISAKTINNGASTHLEPELLAAYESLNVPLLDVHLWPECADLSHRWFHDNWRTIIGRPVTLHPTEDWLSINCIGYHWRTGVQISHRIGRRPHPPVAGRTFAARSKVGDEGAANMLPRAICEGFVAGHLTFGPQERSADKGQVAEWRKMYADIAGQYL